MLHWLDYVVILSYLLGCVGLGFWLERKASKSMDAYFLGDRNMPWWALGASGMASNVDISGTMGLVALVFAMGTAGFFVEIRGGIVLVMVFFMIFMGKWMRRANVMTVAEWMTFRFGNGPEGKVARVITALANLVSDIWVISYFAVGGGKFFGTLVGMDDRLATLVMIGITMAYTVASGFYGAVWTDVFQGGLILVAVLIVVGAAMGIALPETFSVSVPLSDGKTFQAVTTTYENWSNIFLPPTLDFPGQYSAYNGFALVVLFYLFKTSIEGFGGAGGYMGQRYFAAKSDKDAGLLSLLWLFLLSFRWPLITAFAVLGIHYGTTVAPIQDPELVLPTVIQHYAPIGVKGLLISCFMAAAMSTFTSIINSSSAYWVRDIYQIFINPKASDKKLVQQSRIASVVIVALGVGGSYFTTNIIDVWGYLCLAFVGLFVPRLLRWYWWRFNGWGFTWGTAIGSLAAIALRWFPNLGEVEKFSIATGTAVFGAIVAALLTKPTEKSVLENFYRVTRPFGFWGHVRSSLSHSELAQVSAENKRDLISIALAVPWQITLFLAGTLFVMKRWEQFGLVFAVFALLSVGLYFSWFRHLNNRGFQSDNTP
jgi:SSS family solute:Na+ symporter